MESIETPIKILHLEDNLLDSELVQLCLRNEKLNFEYYFADNEHAGEPNDRHNPFRL